VSKKNLVQKNRRRKKRKLKPLKGEKRSVMAMQVLKGTKLYSSTPFLLATSV
jgi:hypothetical protein